jgi:putative hemolysin
MWQHAGVNESNTAANLTLSMARDEAEVREAQRLRYKVFVEEMGARVHEEIPGHDIDLYDRWCEHLLVREPDGGRVVGTYRILSPENARRLGGYYADEEFDLTRLDHLRQHAVEVGRSCVHRDWRKGGVIALLWAGLAEYMVRHGYEYLIGSASVSMADGGINAAAVHHALQRCCASPHEYRVFPRMDLPLRRALPLDDHGDGSLPALIKGYVRLGAYVCGAPAWDPEFNTADLFLLLPMARITPRYAQRLLRHSAVAG